jgi:hypothetical protein
MDDYEGMTQLDWAMYEFATIRYDFRIHPVAADRIEQIFRNLYDEIP